MHLVADSDEFPVEVDPLLLHVDVGPLEPNDFVATHSGHGGQPVDGEEPVPSSGAQELAELVVGQRDALDPLQVPLPRRAGQEGDIAGDEPSTVRIGEGTADDQVDRVHRLRG